MLNPRDIYVRACASIGKQPVKDYFGIKAVGGSDPILLLSAGSKKEVLVLSKFLQTGKGSDALTQAFNLFSSLNDRITLDGLLMFKPLEEICTIQKMKRSVIEAYRDNFFNPADFEGMESKMLFISLIRDEAADIWFKLCAKKSTKEIMFALTGEHTVSEDAVEDLKRIRAKATANYLAFGDFPADALTTGISKEQQRVIIMAQKEAALAIKATQAEMSGSDMLEQLKKFLKDMKMEVQEDSTDQYEVNNSPEIEAGLRAQFERSSPLTKQPESDIPEDMLGGED